MNFVAYYDTAFVFIVRSEKGASNGYSIFGDFTDKLMNALITDGRFSGGTSGLSIGHISPEAANGGNIGKIKDGDIIDIDIPNRTINVRLSDEELAARPQQPLKRKRIVSKALRAYAQSVSSADKGGVRIIE